MQERRRVQRHRTLKSGCIALNQASTIGCRVRNISLIGACLEVESQLGVPDEFVLLVESGHLKVGCHVIWRIASRVGVEFVH